MDNETLPKLNMAREEAILRTRQQGFGKDTLRIWRNSNSVVVGCFSDPRSEVNLDLCWKKGIKVVRRTSGGGAVYHDLGNLNFSATYDVSTPQIPSDILKIYKTFSTSVMAGLSKLGVTSEFRPPNSILSHGKKVSGLAIHKLPNVCLIHGTLLVNTDLQTLHQVLRNTKDEVV
jgi:lipoate-protein ligase A